MGRPPACNPCCDSVSTSATPSPSATPSASASAGEPSQSVSTSASLADPSASIDDIPSGSIGSPSASTSKSASPGVCLYCVIADLVWNCGDADWDLYGQVEGEAAAWKNNLSAGGLTHGGDGMCGENGDDCDSCGDAMPPAFKLEASTGWWDGGSSDCCEDNEGLVVVQDASSPCLYKATTCSDVEFSLSDTLEASCDFGASNPRYTVARPGTGADDCNKVWTLTRTTAGINCTNEPTVITATPCNTDGTPLTAPGDDASEVVSGIFTGSGNYEFWRSRCSGTGGVSTETIGVVNLGATDIEVNGQTVPPGSQWTASPIKDVGPGCDKSGSLGNTRIEVTCPEESPSPSADPPVPEQDCCEGETLPNTLYVYTEMNTGTCACAEGKTITIVYDAANDWWQGSANHGCSGPGGATAWFRLWCDTVGPATWKYRFGHGTSAASAIESGNYASGQGAAFGCDPFCLNIVGDSIGLDSGCTGTMDITVKETVPTSAGC